MTNKRRIVSEIGQLSDFKTLVQTYAEIAAARMQKVRNSVLANRDYLDDLAKVYSVVHTNYEVEMKLIKKTAEIKHNGKTVAVYISANTGLYGDIVRRTFQLFASELGRGGADAVVVGRAGMLFYTEAKITTPVTYFDLSDDNIDLSGIRKIAQFLLPYEQVLVFYGKFESVIAQGPVMSDVTGEIIPQTESGPKVKFLFEPSLPVIMDFFEKEIFTSLFVQTVQESQLAKFASRMIYLDQATGRISDRLKKFSLEKQRVRHFEMNRKQINSLAGASLWGGGLSG